MDHRQGSPDRPGWPEPNEPRSIYGMGDVESCRWNHNRIEGLRPAEIFGSPVGWLPDPGYSPFPRGCRSGSSTRGMAPAIPKGSREPHPFAGRCRSPFYTPVSDAEITITIHFPRINDVGVGGGCEIIRLTWFEQVAIGIEMNHT